eukprot:TRINITY_DN28765_c0_g1_i1.p1 TRINITY_DN28765_c0_g1~~TRINITY_DN28765_c0_g1_i1.p1  ORF type:complete len:356 (+),score=40.10 TRINITY_DN28765_c0_g1_i1:32-1099(+)
MEHVHRVGLARIAACALPRFFTPVVAVLALRYCKHKFGTILACAVFVAAYAFACRVPLQATFVPPKAGPVVRGLPPMTVLTFNVRGSDLDSGHNSWANRRKSAVALAREHRPIVIGMQELQPDQRSDFLAGLPGYRVLLSGVPGTALLYDSSRLELLRSGDEWFAPTPGTVGWDADQPRAAVWGTFRFAASSATVLFVNVHLDHIGAVARSESCGVLRRLIAREAQPDHAVLLSGDFNCARYSPVWTCLSSAGLIDSFVAARQQSPVGYTFHMFQGEKWRHGLWPVAMHSIFGFTPWGRAPWWPLAPGALHVDWVLSRGLPEPLYARVLTNATLLGGKSLYPSDHFPVLYGFPAT